MRPYSKKRSLRNRQVAQFRRALIVEVGRCELCRQRFGLEVHEICRGPHREKALDQRCALLVVCRRCHSERLSSRAEWPESRQLAALKRSRPGDYDLEAYNALVGRGPDRITEEEVSVFFKQREEVR